MEAAGASVLAVLPRHALMVEADAAAMRRLAADPAVTNVEEWIPSQKIAKRLTKMIDGGKDVVEVTVVPLAKDDRLALSSFIVAQHGEIVPGLPGNGRNVRARMPVSLVERLAARGDVRWIEPLSRPRLMNDVAADVAGVRETWNAHGLTGKGQIVTTSDSGLDTGDPATILADFKDRICAIKRATRNCIAKDVNGHGTHTAGSIAGNGALSSGQIKGMAYGARLWVWACCDAQGGMYIPDNERLFAPDAANFPSYIHSASWGDETMENYCCYTAWGEETDEYFWHHPEVLGVFAAGNFGYGGTYGYGAIVQPAGAKNVLAVGAVQNSRSGTFDGYASGNPSAIASYSSRGPMLDGRIKPDICAPGTGIYSTRSTQVSGDTDDYAYKNGTSMATPIVAGAAAIVRQWLVERRGYTNELPTAALMKAILTGGAHDMSLDPAASCGGAAPNGLQGWGRLALGDTLYPSNRSVRLFDRIAFADGRTWTTRVAVTNSAPLDVQLAWIDYPGAPELEDDPALVNDLDLIVRNVSTGEEWTGNGAAGGDRLNNVEGVRIANATPGDYAILVVGHDIPCGSDEGGAAALYVRGAFADGTPQTFGTVLTIR